MISQKLHIAPIFQREAFAFVEAHHRHHKKPTGSVFQIGLKDGAGTLIGVVIVGRPVARALQDGHTLEVTRLCTLGHKNACSMLYAAAWKVTKHLGYRRLVTYILSTEKGTSLEAVGWKIVGQRGGGTWNCPSRNRTDKHPLIPKKMYIKNS